MAEYTVRVFKTVTTEYAAEITVKADNSEAAYSQATDMTHAEIDQLVLEQHSGVKIAAEGYDVLDVDTQFEFELA